MFLLQCDVHCELRMIHAMSLPTGCPAEIKFSARMLAGELSVSVTLHLCGKHVVNDGGGCAHDSKIRMMVSDVELSADLKLAPPQPRKE